MEAILNKKIVGVSKHSTTTETFYLISLNNGNTIKVPKDNIKFTSNKLIGKLVSDIFHYHT